MDMSAGVSTSLAVGFGIGFVLGVRTFEQRTRLVPAARRRPVRDQFMEANGVRRPHDAGASKLVRSRRRHVTRSLAQPSAARRSGTG
jgi:hypothetical protein